MPSQQLDLAQRRVRFLDGKVAEVQRELTAMQADEQTVLARTGERQSGAGQVARWILTRNPLGAAASLLADPISSWFQTRGAVWNEFDQRWAQRIGPKVRTMMSALSSLEQLGGTGRSVDIASYPQAERASATELWTRGNRLAREAARLHGNWIALPMSVHDSANRSLSSRWLQRLVLEGNPLVLVRTALHPGSTASQQAETITGAAASAGEAAQRASEATRQQSAAALLNRPSASGSGRADLPDEPGADTGGGYGTWWSGAVTVALVVAGGFLVVKIVQDVVSKTASTAEEEE
jgi:hypothetical protein